MMKKSALRFRIPPLGGLLGLLTAFLLVSCGSDTVIEPNGQLPPSEQIASFGSLPKWSPDGQKLVFGGEGATAGLWVYDRSSGAVEQITDDAYPHLSDYSWSPGSDSIAFGGAGATIENTSGIFTVALDGSDPVRWHPTGKHPTWAPDGSGLVFAEEDPQTGSYGLFKLSFAGPSVSRLTEEGINPQYNPSGSKIAYRVEPGESLAYPLKVIPASGGAEVTLADSCLHFTWMADGTTLVYDYMSYTAGMRICTIPETGGEKVVIVSSGNEPTVASTGRIAYQKINVDLSYGIYIVNLDGSDNRQLTTSGFSPSITPDGSLVAYARSNGIWLAAP